MKMKYRVARQVSYEQVDGVGYAYIDPLSGDSDIALMHSVYIPENERGKGIGDVQHKERLIWMRESGFEAAICTVNNNNEAEIKILEKNGWQKIAELTYSSIWIKKLGKEGNNA